MNIQELIDNDLIIKLKGKISRFRIHEIPDISPIYLHKYKQELAQISQVRQLKEILEEIIFDHLYEDEQIKATKDFYKKALK